MLSDLILYLLHSVSLSHTLCLCLSPIFSHFHWFSLSLSFSLKLECDKLASEKSEMQRHYIMVSNVFSYNIYRHRGLMYSNQFYDNIYLCFLCDPPHNLSTQFKVSCLLEVSQHICSRYLVSVLLTHWLSSSPLSLSLCVVLLRPSGVCGISYVLLIGCITGHEAV